MLPLEKCLELKNAGFDQELPRYAGESTRVAYQDENFGGVCAVPEDEVIWQIMVARIPTGDELLAECYTLMSPMEGIRRFTSKLGDNLPIRGRIEIWDNTSWSNPDSDNPPITPRMLWSSEWQPNNSDLADAWLWLNERKQRND